MRRLLLALTVLAPASALAQSPGSFPTTAAITRTQLQSALTAKADTLGGTMGDVSVRLGTPPAALTDLQTTPPANGFFSNGAGTYLQFCSVTGCLPGPHLLTQTLVQATTRKDASAQEAGLSVNLLSGTGHAAQWSAGTPYSALAQVHATYSGQDSIYQAGASCVSGTVGPIGLSGTSTDGSCTWTYIGPGINDGKSALATGLHMQAGSGHGWSLVSDLVVDANVGGGSAFGYEQDCSNDNADSPPGASFLMACFFQGGQGPGTLPMLAYRYVSAGGTNTYGAHYGDLFNGANTIEDATFFDATNSNTSLRVAGSHAFGIDLSTATLGTAIVMPSGGNGFIGFVGQTHTLGFNAAEAKLAYGKTTAADLFSIDENGNEAIAGQLTTASNILYAVPVNGASISAVAGMHNFVDPANTLGNLTWVFPSSPKDGDTVSLTTTQAITSLTISAPSVVLGNVSTISAIRSLKYRFVVAAGEWIRTDVAG